MGGQGGLLLALALGLGAARLGGSLAERLGLPPVVGKMAAGLLLGPAVLGAMRADGPLAPFAEVGLVLLMFLAGLESDPAALRSVGVPATAVALGGVALPMLAGLGLGAGLSLSAHEALFLGAILTATSVSISAQTLRELGRLHSRAGAIILGAAVIDDVLGIGVLAAVVAMTGGSSPLESLLRMCLFLGAALLMGPPAARLLDRLLIRFSPQTQLALAGAVALASAWAAQQLGGLAAVTGSYLAGLFLGRTAAGGGVRERLAWLSDGFFVPIFFLAVGLQADPSNLARAPALALGVTAVAVAAKVVGCLIGALASRLAGREALTVAVGMVSRGEVALVVAATGLAAGAIGPSLYSASLAMTAATTVLTPLLLRLALREGHRGEGAVPTALAKEVVTQ